MFKIKFKFTIIYKSIYQDYVREVLTEKSISKTSLKLGLDRNPRNSHQSGKFLSGFKVINYN
jgi:hypothetical protein